MKKNILYILTCLLSVILVGLVIGLFIVNKDDNTNSELTTIKVSEVTHSIFYTPFYVAIENGYFQDEGILIDLSLVSGSDNVAASVLSNDTEVGLAGPESAVYVYLGGNEDYLQVFAGLTKRDGQFLLSRTDNNEFDWHDLEGKEILIGRLTGMPGLSFLRALKNVGVNKDDVKINSSIEFAELSGAFIGGEGDYVNLFEPLASKLENNKEGYIMTSVGAYSDAFPYTAFYAKKSYITKNKELLTKFTNAIKKGLDYTFNNSSEDVAKVIQKQFSDTKIDDLTIMIDHYKEADAWLKNPFVEKEFYNTLIDLLKENNLINKTVSYKDMVYNLYE